MGDAQFGEHGYPSELVSSVNRPNYFNDSGDLDILE